MTIYLDPLSKSDVSRFSGRATIGEILRVALPFVVSSGAFTIKLFCDRVMLAWHSDLAMYAALSAGTAAFMVAALFIGISGYVSAFVAQYHGAGQNYKIGVSVWQSVILSLAFGVLIAGLGRLLAPAFFLAGHPAELAALEAEYFRLLTAGAVFSLINTSLMCFWIGRKKTWTVVAVNLAAIGANILLNRGLIFGCSWSPSAALILSCPPLGLRGAGLATVSSDALKTAALFALFLKPAHRLRFATWPGRLFDPALAARLLRLGAGNGLQLGLSLAALAFFHLLIGLYGPGPGGVDVAVASGIAFSLNGAAVIPLIGLGTAAAVLVGHGLGAGDADYARRVVGKIRLVALIYMVLISTLFIVFPRPLIAFFDRGGGLSASTVDLTAILLWFSAAVFVADGWSMLYGSAIRGAGDTGYAAKVSAITGLMLAPPCLAAYFLGAGAIVLWGIAAAYAAARALAYYLRYQRGAWQKMGLVEKPAASGIRRLAGSRSGAET